MAGLNPTLREMEKIMTDTEFSEEISRSDLMDFLCKFEWNDTDRAKERLKNDFEMFDSNKRGALDAFEIKNILTREGPEAFPEEEVDEVITKFAKEPGGLYNIDNLVTTLLSSTRS